MKNRHFLITATALLMVCMGCTEQMTVPEDLQVAAAVSNWQDSVKHYREQARWGDGKAYLRLAACHHYGRSVERSFLLTYSMALMAERYGGIDSWTDFFLSLPENDTSRLVVEAMDGVCGHRDGEVQKKADLLESLGSPDAGFVRGMLRLKKSEKEEAFRVLSDAAEKGSILAQFAVSVKEDEERTIEYYAEQLPELYCSRARACFNSLSAPDEDEQAAVFYRMADERLCLDEQGVRWLLSYYEYKAREGQPVADEEISRLRLLYEKMKTRHGRSGMYL